MANPTIDQTRQMLPDVCKCKTCRYSLIRIYDGDPDIDAADATFYCTELGTIVIYTKFINNMTALHPLPAFVVDCESYKAQP